MAATKAPVPTIAPTIEPTSEPILSAPPELLSVGDCGLDNALGGGDVEVVDGDVAVVEGDDVSGAMYCCKEMLQPGRLVVTDITVFVVAHAVKTVSPLLYER